MRGQLSNICCTLASLYDSQMCELCVENTSVYLLLLHMRNVYVSFMQYKALHYENSTQLDENKSEGSLCSAGYKFKNHQNVHFKIKSE